MSLMQRKSREVGRADSDKLHSELIPCGNCCDPLQHCPGRERGTGRAKKEGRKKEGDVWSTLENCQSTAAVVAGGGGGDT